MANQDKDRVSEETLAPSAAAGFAETGPRPGVLAVRLWSAAGKRIDCRAAKSVPPLLGLVRDLVRASGGVIGSENADSVSASFSDVVTGLQCARRIQWAVEGLTEYDPFRGAAAAILLDAGNSGQRLASISSEDWGAADPGSIQGKILLRGGASEALEGVPGVTLGQATTGGWREWAWKSGPANASFATDEQTVLGMLRAAGRADPAAAVAVPNSADNSAAAQTRVFGSASASISARELATSGSGAETGTSAGAGKGLRIPMVAGAVAVLLIAVAVVFFLTRRSPVQSATPSTPPAGQRAAPPTQVPAIVPNPPGHANAPNPPSKHMKLSDVLKKLAPADQKATTPPPVTSRCDLTEEDIQRSLARADRYMHDGDLDEARAAYQHVLGCSTAHERAQEGLIRIQKMAAQNGSPNL